MPPFHVLVTDYAWPTLDIERSILADANAELLVAETGQEDELIRLVPEVDAILTCWKPVTAALLDAAPRCRIVSRYGVGLDNVAIERATELGIVVANVPDFCLEEVSDHALALILACARRIVDYAHATRSGVWNVREQQGIPRLRGQTLGLIGYGNIAQALARKARALGLEILAYSPRLSPGPLAAGGRATNDLGDLLRASDYVSIHAPLTEETRGLIDAAALRLMKPTAYLINTARGAIIDEGALIEALRAGHLAGAALDVMAQEPPAPTNALLTMPNVIVTPHAAFYSEAAIEELASKAATHVAQALRGELPGRVVNPQVVQKSNFRLAGPAVE